jgi:UDP-N-acetylmuramyl pentapeptide phosphotransferase/UDP-N-acetylglucosamine-1-phosphate transferase
VSGNVVTLSVLAVLVASFAVCALLIVTQRWHGSLSLDHDLTGAQKIHQNPVPRVGGIGVMIGLLVGVGVGYAHGGSTWPLVSKLLACAIPVFGAGLIEDLTKRVSVKTRLVASFVSALLAAWTLDASLIRLDTPVLDDLMAWTPAALLFTSFAVAGMTNAINIIDGLNGLASGAVGLMLAGLAGIAWQAGDMQVFKMCLWGIAAMGGFLALNYPFGRIFLGDGGAYLAGFWLAECAVMLLHRNPGVSTWAVLLCVMYPTWETLYSMYRRNIKQKVSSGLPDMVHFHHLIFKAAARLLGPQGRVWLRHGAASAFVWVIVATCQLGALLTWEHHGAALVLALGFVVLYLALYSSIGRKDWAMPASMQPEFSAGSSGA